MKVTKLRKGKYKVEIGNQIIIIRDQNNPDLNMDPYKRWEAWTVGEDMECTDLNCWACGAPNKKTLLRWIQEDYRDGFLGLKEFEIKNKVNF